jgi:hypothetical protein
MSATVASGWRNNLPVSAGVRDECDGGQQRAQQVCQCLPVAAGVRAQAGKNMCALVRWGRVHRV